MPINRRRSLARKLVSKPTVTESQIPETVTRPGTVVAVNSDGTVDVSNVGGSTNVIADVPTTSGYIGKVGDEVSVDFSDFTAVVTGKTTGDPTVFRGFAAAAPVATDETIAGGAYGDVTTPGPSTTVTVGESGVLIVVVSCTMTVTDNNDGGFMSFALSGANTVAPADASAFQFFPKVTGAYHRGSYVKVLTGLTPGATTVTAKYKTSGADITFKDREVSAMPL